jgi:hypothetical protein
MNIRTKIALLAVMVIGVLPAAANASARAGGHHHRSAAAGGGTVTTAAALPVLVRRGHVAA